MTVSKIESESVVLAAEPRNFSGDFMQVGRHLVMHLLPPFLPICADSRHAEFVNYQKVAPREFKELDSVKAPGPPWVSWRLWSPPNPGRFNEHFVALLNHGHDRGPAPRPITAMPKSWFGAGHRSRDGGWGR